MGAVARNQSGIVKGSVKERGNSAEVLVRFGSRVKTVLGLGSRVALLELESTSKELWLPAMRLGAEHALSEVYQRRVS
jgi:hypothetical protein